MFSARCFLPLLFAIPAALVAQPCPEHDLKAAAQQVKTVQTQLLAVKLQDEIDEGVSASLQTQIGAFKDAFASLADAALACAPANIDPTAAESVLAKLIDANKSEVEEVYDPKRPPQLDHIYGRFISVKISRPRNEPRVLLIGFGFGIECDGDTMLLAYELGGQSWTRVLRWQSPTYDTISAAFGDFFEYVVLPQADSNKWQIVFAHGAPWCASRWSGFSFDLIQPASDGTPQKVLQHIKHDYVRGDVDPSLKLTPGRIPASS